MKYSLTSLFIGFLFALGLGISGMTNPQNVISFLDLSGKWNPSLIFVMIGAIVVHSISYRLIMKRSSPFFSKEFHVPQRRDIDRSLILGSFIFGLGWGLAGFCPAPAITALTTLHAEVFIFFISMLSGMMLFRLKNYFLGKQ